MIYRLLRAATLTFSEKSAKWAPFGKIRVKVKLEQLPCEQFLQAFEIYRALLRAKQVGEKSCKIRSQGSCSNFSFTLASQILKDIQMHFIGTFFDVS